MTKAAIIRLSDYKQNMGGAGISAKAHNESVNEKLAKDSVEVEKKNLSATEILNSSLKNLTFTIKEQIKSQGGVQGAVGDKAEKVKSYKGAGGAVKERVDSVKDFFTLRGFLDKTGIVKKGSTGMLSGIADAALEKREAKQQYVKDRLNVDKNYVKGIGGGEAKASKTFANQFDKGNDALIKVQENSKAMAGLSERGFSESQVKRSTEAGNQAGLEADLAQKDSRFRDGIARTASGQPKVEKASSGRNDNVIPLFKKESKEERSSSGVSDAMSTSEEEMENARLMALQTDTLIQIEENTRLAAGGGAKDGGDDKKKESAGVLGKMMGGATKWIGGLIDSLMGVLASVGGMLMSGLTSALKFLFNPKMLMKIFGKVLLPLAIVGALVSGIMDGFNAFMETGSIGEALIAGLGGILDFLTFGLIDAKVIRNVVDWLNGFVDEWIIQPITNFFNFLGDAFQTYIAEPITAAFTMVGNLFTEYILDPLKEIFSPIADFFKKIKDQVFGFLEDFGIPEISFTIPIIGKKVSIGPFYPFRPDEGVDKIGTGAELNTKSSAAGESSNFKENINVTNKDESTVLNTDEGGSMDANGNSTYKSSRTIAKLDARTGKASYSNEDTEGNEIYNKEISNSAFRDIKRASARNAGSDEIKNIIKEDEAYQKLSWFDRRKVDVGFAKATDLAPAQKGDLGYEGPKAADKVSTDSKAVEAGKATPPPAITTTVVNNSKVSNQKATTAVAAPTPRNYDNRSYYGQGVSGDTW